MFHPLAEDISSLSDDELQEKITTLTKKYTAASRFPDQSLISQVQSMLTMYVEEQRTRYRKQLDKQRQKEKKMFLELKPLLERKIQRLTSWHLMRPKRTKAFWDN